MAIFEGICTALITPLTAAGVDYEMLGKLIDWQIEQGVDALCICGTTGEASTLSDAEHKDTIAFAVERAAHRVPIIAGTGANETAYAIELTRFAAEAGADAGLVVTPYYNKTTQKGLIRHYGEVADASSMPIILYNVPGRTGLSIEPATYLALSKHGNIAAIKEAGGNVSKIAETMALIGDSMTLYSGNDDQIVPLMALGAKGCISVLANVMPAGAHELCRRALDGDFAGALELQLRWLPLINALFSEVNPIPVKAAMAAMGWCENFLRGPLYPMEDPSKLLAEMRAAGIGF